MTWFGLIRRVPVILGAVVIVLATASSTHADVISSTPTLPLLDIPYLSSTGVGCFPAAGVCVSSGSFTLTSVLSSNFNASGQDINTTVEYAGVLTNLSNVPIGPVHLSGVLEQEVLGRTFSTETGSWATDLIALSLSGPVLGHTLTLTLDPAQLSTGATSITPIGELFRIDSFFDVFVDLSLELGATAEYPARPNRSSGWGPRSHRRCWSARSDLGERWPSRLVATAAEDRLSIKAICTRRLLASDCQINRDSWAYSSWLHSSWRSQPRGSQGECQNSDRA